MNSSFSREVQGEDYDSSFENDDEIKKKRAKRTDLTSKSPPRVERRETGKVVFDEEHRREEGRNQTFHFRAMDSYARHKMLINDYLLYYKGATSLLKRDTSGDKTDIDVIRENHRFLWSGGEATDTWGKRMAKKYYEKLFKEYCIADLSRYKENKIALRWRTETEVVDGKGQFTCGHKTCNEKENLRSWEVNFGYLEHGVKKNALVKLRLCTECSYKINYRHQKKEIKPKKRKTHSKESQFVDEIPPITDDREKQQTTEKAAEGVSGDTEKRTDQNEGNLWKGPPKLDEKSREDEFDEYLEELFL